MLLVLVVLATSGIARAESVPSHPVLSYLLFAGDGAPTQPGPWDPGPSRKAIPERWEWRLFDPVSRIDTLFMTFDVFPVHMRWNPAFREVEFLLGDRVMRRPWRAGAAMVEQVRLPSDSSVCDFWESKPGLWHSTYQETFRTEAAEGYSYGAVVATRWDHAKAAWVAAVVDTGGDPETCLTSERLDQDAPRPPRIEIQAMMDSMRIGNYRDSSFSTAADPKLPYDEMVWIALSEDRSMGLEMGAVSGDTYHALAPVVWVDRANSLRVPVYALGQTGEFGNDQIAFGVRGDFLLIATEFEGGNPEIVDLRNGKIVMRVDGPSARAVWVPAPEGWR